ncbi:MAG: hypothetical protein OEY89_14400 [Gammaproteobacteria bacterium]|nr:hypothetical protein [Gammaproteobacteria bacterium]
MIIFIKITGTGGLSLEHSGEGRIGGLILSVSLQALMKPGPG